MSSSWRGSLKKNKIFLIFFLDFYASREKASLCLAVHFKSSSAGTLTIPNTYWSTSAAPLNSLLRPDLLTRYVHHHPHPFKDLCISPAHDLQSAGLKDTLNRTLVLTRFHSKHPFLKAGMNSKSGT